MVLPSRMIINGAKLMVGPAGKHWIALPALMQFDRDGNPRLDANGKQIWTPIVGFDNRNAADQFRGLVLEALRRQYPKAFETTNAVTRPAPSRSRGAYSRPQRPAGGGETIHDDPVDDLGRGDGASP